jgi:hypothetical protein
MDRRSLPYILLYTFFSAFGGMLRERPERGRSVAFQGWLFVMGRKSRLEACALSFKSDEYRAVKCFYLIRAALGIFSAVQRRKAAMLLVSEFMTNFATLSLYGKIRFY